MCSPPQKATGGEQNNVVMGEFCNVEIPLEPCIVVKGLLEGLEVSILIDGGCNTNMVSKSFVERNRSYLINKLGPTKANISHSREGLVEQALEALEGGEMVLGDPGDTELKYNSNWLVGTARYDVILGMPWHKDCRPQINYHTRDIRVCQNDTLVVLRETNRQDTQSQEADIKVHSMSAKQFRRALKKNRIAEVFHVTARNTKLRKSKHQENRSEHILKGAGDSSTEVAFSELKARHKEFPQLVQLLEENREIFRTKLPPGLPPVRAVDHSIDTEANSKPPFRRLYQLSPAELLAAKDYITENLKSGKIRPSKSPYGSPMFFAKEKDGSLRGVVDYRGLNRITKRNSTSVPRSDEMFDRLGQAKVFSKIDLKTGFHQIRIRPEDIEKTAFTTKYGQFEYTVMAMGLCNAPATFQTLMNSIFRDVIDKFLVIYLDDILIYSDSEEEHMKHVKLVLERLKENCLYISPKKCDFVKEEVEFLGLRAGKKGVRVDPAKIEVIQNWPKPENITELRGFLGLVQFFKRFIKNFSAKARPLTDLTKKDKGIAAWNDECSQSFEELKQTLISAPVLIAPDWTKPFELHVDASQYAVGATLTQNDEDRRPHVIAYSSKKMTPAEQNYTANDRELLALVTGLQRFRCYLEGATFSVITDNQVVSFFFSKPSLSRREARWLEILADFNISTLNLKPGRINVLGDALSRIRHDEKKIENSNIDVVQVSDQDVVRTKLEAYGEDQAFGPIFRSFNNKWPDDPKEKKRIELLKPSFELIDGKLYYEGRVCVPRKAVSEIIKLAHDSRLAGHFGFTKTLGRLSNYHWKHKTRDVRSFCDGCSTCQQQKDHGGLTLNDPTALELPTRRWGMVATDFITHLPVTESGFDAITTWVDRLSRRVHFIPSRTNDTAEDAARSFFRYIMPHHGLPDAIISDRDPKFTSKFWKELMNLCGVKLRMSSSRHPQTDGASEVMNRMVENYIRCYCEHKQRDWDLLLPAAEFAYNSAISEDLGATPFEIDLGWKPRDPLQFMTGKTSRVQAASDLKAQLEGAFRDARYAHQIAKARQCAEAGKHSKAPTYKTGDKLWVSRKLWVDQYSRSRPSAKLSARWFGPFTISKIIGKNAVKLELPAHIRTHPVVHVSLTKPATDKPLHLQDEVPARPELIEMDSDGAELFKVSKILAHRKAGKGYRWLTLMEGDETHEATWQPTKDFVDNDGTITEAFRDYIKEHSLLPDVLTRSEG